MYSKEYEHTEEHFNHELQLTILLFKHQSVMRQTFQFDITTICLVNRYIMCLGFDRVTNCKQVSTQFAP